MSKTISLSLLLSCCFITLGWCQYSPSISLSTTPQERWIGIGIKADSLYLEPQIEIKLGVVSSIFQSNLYPAISFQNKLYQFNALHSSWRINSICSVDVLQFRIHPSSSSFYGLTPQLGLSWSHQNKKNIQLFVLVGWRNEWYRSNKHSVYLGAFYQPQIGINYVFP